jgi:hypothetical protein
MSVGLIAKAVRQNIIQHVKKEGKEGRERKEDSNDKRTVQRCD